MIAILALFAAYTSAADVIAPFVADLNADTFDDFIKAESATIVKFYAPWCGHCKRMAPAFEEAGKQLKGDARLGEVDCTQHKELCGKFGVRGYPTLLVFKNGEHDKYAGKRETGDFVDAVRAALPEKVEEEEEDAPAVTVIDSQESLNTFIATEPATIIKFYAPWCGHCKRMAVPYEEAGNKLAGEARIAEVDCTQHKDVCGEFGVRGYPTLKVFRGSKDSVEDYHGQRTTDDFVKAVREALPAADANEKSEL